MPRDICEVERGRDTSSGHLQAFGHDICLVVEGNGWFVIVELVQSWGWWLLKVVRAVGVVHAPTGLLNVGLSSLYMGSRSCPGGAKQTC